MLIESFVDSGLCSAADGSAWRGRRTSKSVESTRRVSGSPSNSGRTVPRKGCRKHLSLVRCPHAAQNARLVRFCNAHVYTGTSSGLGKGRIRLLGQSPSPEKVQYGWRF
jgi:hypothetical protein